MRTIIGWVLLSLALQSEAGTVLRFQNGDVNAKDLQTQTQLSFGSLSEDFVVQFKEAVTEADKKGLVAQGIQIFRYLPDDALIVRASAAQLQHFARNHQVNAFVPYKGSVKLSTALPIMSVFSKDRRLPVAILTFTVQDKVRILNFLKMQDPNLQVLDETGTTLSVQLPQSLIPSLMDKPGVEFVQEIVKIEPMHILLDEPQTADASQISGDYKDLSGFETGTKLMNFTEIWNQGYHGQGQIVAMADSGLDVGNSPDLSLDFKSAVVKGHAFGIGAKGSWDDPMGHGTHVAGSVLGRGTASEGVLHGGAYESSLIPQGMWSPIINNLTVPPKLNQLFQSAYDDGARIHTNSWGAAREDLFGSYEAMAQQVDQFMWEHPDFLILYAAGNSGVDMNKDGRIDPNSVGPPGTAKNTLTVGASENLLAQGGIQKQVKELRNAADLWGAEPIWSSKLSDNANGVAMFSSRGPLKDGRLKPEVVAPGTNILSARSHHPKAQLLWGEYNKDYVYSGGTSMATPLVAGAAAVVREVLVEKFKISQPSAALIKATLMHTATDLFPGQYGTGAAQELKTRRPNSDEGYGLVNMAQVAGLSSNQTQFVEAQVAQGAEFKQKVQVKGGKLLVNLVYTDAPGTPAAGVALVNDLNLEVVGPLESGSTAVFSSKDAINNSEVAELSGLATGSYEIRVKGTKIPMGKDGQQPFALVSTAN